MQCYAQNCQSTEELPIQEQKVKKILRCGNLGNKLM